MAAVIARRLRAETTVTEELGEGPDPGREAAGTANVIHTAEGARSFGYQGALVAGVLLFGWCVPPLVEALGPDWLTRGWAFVQFRRPVYTGAELAVRVTNGRPAVEFSVDVEDAGRGVQGEAGLGRPAWAEQLADLPRRDPEPPLGDRPRPRLSLAVASPSELRTLDATVEVAAAQVFGRSQPEPLDAFGGARPLVHPALLARQMISLLAHSYDYGRPSIHVSTHLQLLGPVPAGEPLALSGRLVETYERRGHHYAVIDGSLHGPAADAPLARLRHTNIFRVAPRPPG